MYHPKNRSIGGGSGSERERERGHGQRDLLLTKSPFSFSTEKII